MSKLRVLLILLPLILSSCFSLLTDPVAPKRELFFRLKNNIGDTLCYKRALSGSFPERDTIYGYSVWTIRTDTVILMDTFLIYEGTEYLEGFGTIDTIPRKMLVKHDEFGVECYDVDLGYAGDQLQSGPLRGNTKLNEMSYNQLIALFSGARNTPSKARNIYMFMDHQQILEYPLQVQGSWKNRDSDNLWGHRSVTKLCHGYDTIMFDGKEIETVMTELLLKEQVANKDLMLFQWYDTLGIVQELHGYGEFTTKDDYKLTPFETFKRIPYAQVNIGSLKPY